MKQQNQNNESTAGIRLKQSSNHNDILQLRFILGLQNFLAKIQYLIICSNMSSHYVLYYLGKI